MGADIYITHFPCLQCTKAIIQSGIKNVYYASDYKNDPYAIEILNKAGVNVVHVPFNKSKIDFLKEREISNCFRFVGEVTTKWRR